MPFNFSQEEVVRKVKETANGVSFNGKNACITSLRLWYSDTLVKERGHKNTTKELITKELSMGLIINEIHDSYER